jgi:mediator of RNA polymerase II transcription subunit 24
MVTTPRSVMFMTPFIRGMLDIKFISSFQTLDADYSKNQDALLGVLCHMMSGKSFELILAAAAATGKLQSFAVKLIK